MATLCSICQDYLTERPQALRPEEDVIMCALSCGHLFHRVCVSQWFNRNAAGRGGLHDGLCPCCKKNASLNTALRVYPTGDEEGDRMVRQDRDLKKVTEENLRLHAEKEELRQQLRRAQSRMEEEVVAHDILKMEYGQAASRCDNMQIELQEGNEMKLAIENSFKTALEKSDGEKKEALQRLTELETQHNDTLIQMQHLKEQVDKLQLQDARRRQENHYLQQSLFSKDGNMEKFTGNEGTTSRATAGRLVKKRNDSCETEPELVELTSDSGDESPVRTDAHRILAVPQSEGLNNGFDAFFNSVKKDICSIASDSDSANSVD